MEPNENVVRAVDEADIILPPPSASNPIPALGAALRLDNLEQLLQLLKTDPHAPTADSKFRQILVFADDSMRTLLLRQVLSDPNQRTFKGKKNWDAATFYPMHKDLRIVKTHILMQENGTEPLEEDASVDVVTYFLRPADLRLTEVAATHVQSWKKNFRTHHRLVYMPQPTLMVQKVLQNLNITDMPNVSVQRLQLDVFPLETDILSLEYPDAVAEDAEKIPSHLITAVARSILKLQDVVGPIPRLQTYGPLGEEVARKLLHMAVNEYLVSNDCPEDNDGLIVGGDVAALVVMDRAVDRVSPLLTPLTYEGLLDDVVGVDCGFIKVDVNVINPEEDDNNDEKKTESQEPVALGVLASDTLFAEVRNQHVEKFGAFLQNQAMALRESHANFTSHGKKRDLSEIHQFVRQIPVFTQNLRSLTNHIHLAELVKKRTEESSFRERWQTERAMVEGELCYDFLEELVATQHPPERFFRLLCLQSICSGGIKSSRYDTIRRDVVQTYGFEYMFVLRNLERAGYLRRREGLWIDNTSSFHSLRKALILINAEVNTLDPDDVSYVSSGYAPLSVRLLQTAVKGWSGRDDVLRELPGRVLDLHQYSPPKDLAAALKSPPSKSLGSAASDLTKSSTRKPVMIIMYVGGVSYMEIAALRFLSKRSSFPYHIIIATTKVINGTRLLHSLG